MLFTITSVFVLEIFKFLKYANQPSDILNQILIKYDERYLSQFLSEIFDPFSSKNTKCAPELKSFVTMATY